MKLFLAGIIQGSLAEARIHSQDWRTPIRQLLQRHCPGADVYCHYERHPDSIAYDLPEILATLEDGNLRAAEADAVICWLPSASMGTAVEMYVAAQAGAAVVAITPLEVNWIVRAYADVALPDLDAFEQFLAAGGLTELVDRKRTRRGGD